MKLGHAFTVLLFAATAAACQQQQNPPLYASSADEPAYAERYPAELAAARAQFAKDETEVTTLTSEFQKYPDELDKPSWPVVETVVEEADRAGKSWDYAAARSEEGAVRDFFEEEKKPLVQKVGGAVEYAAKEKNCEGVEYYGPVSGGLERGVNHQLEERLRSRSVAHRTIEDNQDGLGKQNIDKLEKQADKIAFASYLVNVRLPQTKRDLDAALADASGVKQTLARTREQAKAVEDDPQASKAAKQLAQKRSAAASEAEAQLDNEVAEAQKLSDEMEQRTNAAKKTYEDALAALLDAIETRAQEAEATAKK